MSLPLAPGAYALDRSISQIGCSVRHLGLSTVRGWFEDYDGTLEVGETLDDVVVAFTARMASFNSGNRMRDEGVQKPDFFDSAQFPELAYRSTRVRHGDSKQEFVMDGDLSIRGVVLPVSLDVRFTGTEVSVLDHKLHAGFEATGAFRRSEIGMDFGAPIVSDRVKLQIDVQFVPA